MFLSVIKFVQFLTDDLVGHMWLIEPHMLPFACVAPRASKLIRFLTSRSAAISSPVFSPLCPSSKLPFYTCGPVEFEMGNM